MNRPPDRRESCGSHSTLWSRRAWFAGIASGITAIGSSVLRGEARWASQTQFGQYRCYADFPLAQIKTLLRELAFLKRDVEQRLRIKPSKETIHLIFFDKNSSYRSYIKTYFPKVPYRRALYIRERGVGMLFAYRNPDLITDIRHETTHAILHASLPMVPLWLDEGLAEYFEVARGQRGNMSPHLNSVQWSLFFGGAPRMEKLESITSLNKMGATQYRDAWAWVHWMMHGPPQAYDELLSYLSDIERHNPPGNLSRRLQRRIKDVNGSFVTHFRKWKNKKKRR